MERLSLLLNKAEETAQFAFCVFPEAVWGYIVPNRPFLYLLIIL